jgi:uncharacterized protein
MHRITRKAPAAEQIERIVKRIAKKFRPDTIILFGSQARGDAGPDSDIDLLVVMPVDGSVYEKRLEIGVAIPDRLIPADIVVATPEDFAGRKDVVGTIEWHAAREGKVLYARA